MAIVKVISFMHAVVRGKSGKLVIEASQVNRFCDEMQKRNVDCELDMGNFSDFASRFPHEIQMTPTKITVDPSDNLKSALQDISRFDIDRPRFQDIYRFWVLVSDEI